MSKAVGHLRIINRNDEWETPPDVYKAACLQYGVKPQLDVCATRQSRKCRYYYTKEDDGLAQQWDRPFYANPPYSQVRDWVIKADHEVHAHGVVGLLLTFAKVDTKWWHDYIEGQHKVHFHRGRINFWRDGKPGPSVAPYPSCWILMRPWA